MGKIFNKRTLIIADALIIPAVLFCRWLSAFMLSRESACSWALLGGKCVSCGGTHFVYNLLRGKVAEAFECNQFFFILLIVLAASLVLLHLHLFFNIKFARKALEGIYSIPSLIIASALMLIFLVARNMPLFMQIWK